MSTRTYTSAAAADILGLLNKPDVRANDFKRIEDIAKIGILLCNAEGTPMELEHHAQAIRDSEYKAPALHAALVNRAFDGETVLRKKYDEVSALHSDLRVKALHIADAQARAEIQQKRLDVHEEALKEYEHSLSRERERLLIRAGSSGIDLSLPVLPSLDVNETEDEEE